MSLQHAERLFLRDDPGADDVVADGAHRPIVWVQRERRVLSGMLAAAAVLVIVGVAGWWVFEPTRDLVFWHLRATLDRSPAPADATTLAGIALLAIALSWLVAWAILPARRIRFYRDLARTDLLMELRQDSRWQLGVERFTLFDPDESPIARLRHYRALGALLPNRWTAATPDGATPLCRAIERPIYLAPLRRLFGPLGGLLRTNVAIACADGSSGRLIRRLPVLGHRPLELSGCTIDGRIVTALAVMANRDA